MELPYLVMIMIGEIGIKAMIRLPALGRQSLFYIREEKRDK